MSTSTGTMFANCEGATPEHWAMVTANMGLVYSVVNRETTRFADRDDAVQDGVFGLLRAAMKFDPTLGYAFSTYAMAWIVQAVRRGWMNREGANARAAVRAGVLYTAPLSIDATVGEDDTMDLGDLLVAEDDPESDVVTSALVDELVDTLRGSCLDYLDLAAVDGFLSGVSTAETGRRVGVSGQTIRNRFGRVTIRAARALTCRP